MWLENKRMIVHVQVPTSCRHSLVLNLCVRWVDGLIVKLPLDLLQVPYQHKASSSVPHLNFWTKCPSDPQGLYPLTTDSP